MPDARSFSIRRLGPQDAGALRNMLNMFAEAFEDDDSYRRAQPSECYLQDLLHSPMFIAIVAEHDGSVIGGLAAYELKKFERERSEIYIYDLATSEQHRRLGVATGLIEALKHVARERGAHVIYVQADYGDDPAIALYTKLGTREDVLHFDIDVA